MNPSSSPSRMTAARMASSTNAAGPSLWKDSKTDPIFKSKTRLLAVLRAPLIGREAGQILARGELEAQAAAVGLRGKTSDLVHVREVLRADAKEEISRELPVAPRAKRKAQFGHAGGAPFH